MSSFLDLPEELSGKIIEEVLLGECPFEPVLEEYHRLLTLDRKSREGMIIHEDKTPVANATALMLVSRAVHEQAKSAIARLYPNGVDYKLDVAFLRERHLCPRWLHVPAVARLVNSVDVTFRIFGYNVQERNQFRGGCGGPPTISWLFNDLLEEFLLYGIQPPGNEKRSDRTSSKATNCIKNLHINIVSGEPDAEPEDTEALHNAWRDRVRHRSGSYEGEAFPMHPRWLAGFLSGMLSILCRAIDGLYESYGKLINERVDKIFVSANGQQYDTIDVGARLGQMSAPDRIYEDCRGVALWNWKFQALQERESLGLPVPSPDDVLWPNLKEWRRAIVVKEEAHLKAEGNPYRLGCIARKMCAIADRGLSEMLERHESESAPQSSSYSVTRTWAR